jgi:putative two-component system hydrogenase maturation factor HypX/HoxX
VRLYSYRLNEKYRVFGAHLEANPFNSSRYEPGQIIAQRNGAVLVKCGEGALWLSHLKKNKLKLPAASWLQRPGTGIPSLPEPNLEIVDKAHPSTFQVPIFVGLSKILYFSF